MENPIFSSLIFSKKLFARREAEGKSKVKNLNIFLQWIKRNLVNPHLQNCRVIFLDTLMQQFFVRCKGNPYLYQKLEIQTIFRCIQGFHLIDLKSQGVWVPLFSYLKSFITRK